MVLAQSLRSWPRTRQHKLTQKRSQGGTYYTHIRSMAGEYTIGVSRGTEGHNYYCRQIAMEERTTSPTDSSSLASDDTSRRLAWLINGNRLKTDALLHAAIGTRTSRLR